MNYVQTCIFKAMVYVKRARIMANQLNHWVQNYVLEDENPTLKLSHFSEKWGRSAPSLESAPVIPPRSMSSRIVGAKLISSDGSKEDCTQVFQNFLEQHNVLERKDIFVNNLENFLKITQTELVSAQLVVTFKNGMRQCTVFYNKDIVFPPSVSSPSTAQKPRTQPIHEAKLFGENGFYIICTPYVRSLAGPMDDFYVGSSYETTPGHVFQLMSLDHTTLFQYTDSLQLTMENGTSIKLPLDKTQCIHTFIDIKH